jgi:catechol 2,3-dioxygenase-like lactoylglutathione lyase family enzyme
MPAIHHLALRTRDVAGLASFYSDWFDLRCVRDLAPRALWLGLEQAAVLMIEAAAPDEPAPPPQSLELIAFGVSAERRGELRAALIARGLLEAETEHTVYFRDPDGRRVAASSYPLGLRGAEVPA